MAEDISTILNKSFNAWRSNLLITAIYVLQGIVGGIVIIPFAIALVVAIVILAGAGAVNISDGDLSSLQSISVFVIALIMLFMILLFIILLLIGSFFTAGIIGMCKNSILTGKTTINDFIKYGKLYFKNTLGVNIISLIVTFAAVAFFAAVFIAIFILIGMFSGAELTTDAPTAGQMVILAFIFLMGLVAYILIFFISQIMTFLVYGTALEEKSLTEGLKKAWEIVKNNSRTVLQLIAINAIFVIAVLLINMGSEFLGVNNAILGIVFMIVQMVFGIIGILFWEPFMIIAYNCCYINAAGIESEQVQEKQQYMQE
ncbi:MAG: hypothetical protein GX362_06910, partial [Methanosarcinaceae archaeon]|nr:hypothetical protein [Methanosarcinaceae archaeon]